MAAEERARILNEFANWSEGEELEDENDDDRDEVSEADTFPVEDSEESGVEEEDTPAGDLLDGRSSQENPEEVGMVGKEAMETSMESTANDNQGLIGDKLNMKIDSAMDTEKDSSATQDGTSSSPSIAVVPDVRKTYDKNLSYRMQLLKEEQRAKKQRVRLPLLYNIPNSDMYASFVIECVVLHV